MAQRRDHRRGTVLWLSAIVGTCALRLIYPGDVPWIADEPYLILTAVDLNQHGQLAAIGNVGSKGVPYGPIPLWIYQALTAVTHDPVTLVMLHAVLLSAVAAMVLIWLAQLLSLNRWFVVVILLGPYLWYYDRVLWDSTFTIPLCALAIAAYVAFLRRRSAWMLILAATCLPTLWLIHPMSLALIAAMAAHMLWFERRALRRYRWALAVMIAAFGLATWRYQTYLWMRPVMTNVMAEPGHSMTKGLAFAWLGARYLGGTGLGYFFNRDWLAAMGPIMGPVYRAAVAVSALAYVLSWFGAAMAINRWWMIARRSAVATATDHAALLALLVIVTQMALDAATGRYDLPQYFNATWIAAALLAWIAVTRLGRFAPVVITAQGAAAAAVIVCLILHTHATGGTRDIGHGPNLAVQMDIVRQCARYAPPTAVRAGERFFTESPHALGALRRLIDLPPTDRPPADLTLHFATKNPADAHLQLTPTTPDTSHDATVW